MCHYRFQAQAMKATCVRGNTARNWTWGDLILTVYRACLPDHMVVIYLRSLVGKTIKENREDLFPLARHKHPLLCGCFGIAVSIIMCLVHHRGQHPLTLKDFRSMIWCVLFMYAVFINAYLGMFVLISASSADSVHQGSNIKKLQKYFIHLKI